MLEELKKISDEITKIIREDSFCYNIEPFCLKDAVLSYPMCAGKRLRPAMLLWACGLLGGDVEKAKYAAAAVEIYHNWTLVHDDIIDNDDVRRGNPSAHMGLKNYALKNYSLSDEAATKYGVDFAILAGDLQHAWANYFLLKSVSLGVPSDVVISICSDMAFYASTGLVSGEALDIDFSYRNIEEIAVDEIERMIFLKTGVLLNFAISTGAKIALSTCSRDDERINRLMIFSTALGSAFQLKDDWLGIYGDVVKFGKPIGSDIISAKPTLLIKEALSSSNTEQNAVIKSYLGKPDLTENDLKIIRKIITETGAEQSIKDKIARYKLKAESIMESFPDSVYKDNFLDLNRYLECREV